MAKRGVATLLLFALVVGVFPIVLAGPTPSFEHWLDEHIPDLLSRYRVPGAAVSLIEDGHVVRTKAYGFADVEKREPVTDRTVFQVASISKSLTAWGVMKLVENGRVDLDEPVDRYLKRWHLPPSKYNDDVTVRRVLSHTAGLSLMGFPGNDPNETLPTLVESLEGKNSGGIAVRVIERPAKHWRYSGGGYSVLQLLIEDVTGRSFEKYMKETVLRPLGMGDSSYVWERRLRRATARAYSEVPNSLPNYLYTEQAAAGLYTTVRDLARWVTAVVSPDAGGVLEAKSLRAILAPAAATGGAFGAYGVGVGTERLRDGRRLVWHTGGNRGWSAIWIALPTEGDGLVIATNSNTGALLYADASCEWSHAVAGDTPQLCTALAGLRSIMVRLSIVAAVVLLVYLASVAVAVPRKRRVLRRPRGLRWTRVFVFPLLALTWFGLWHTKLLTGVIGLGLTPAIAFPTTFRWASLLMVASLALVAVTAFFPNLEPRPSVTWRQRAALAGALGVVWLVLLYTDAASRVALRTPGPRPATMLTSGAEIVAIAVVFAALALGSFAWRRKRAGRTANVAASR